MIRAILNDIRELGFEDIANLAGLFNYLGLVQQRDLLVFQLANRILHESQNRRRWVALYWAIKNDTKVLSNSTIKILNESSEED